MSWVDFIKLRFHVSDRLNSCCQDVLFGDIDHMETSKDFTYDAVNYAGLPNYIDHLHSIGMRFITILVSQITFQVELLSDFISFNTCENILFISAIVSTLSYHVSGQFLYHTVSRERSTKGIKKLI